MFLWILGENVDAPNGEDIPESSIAISCKLCNFIKIKRPRFLVRGVFPKKLTIFTKFKPPCNTFKRFKCLTFHSTS